MGEKKSVTEFRIKYFSDKSNYFKLFNITL